MNIALLLLIAVLYIPIFGTNKIYQSPKQCEILAKIKVDPEQQEPMKLVLVSSVLTNCSPVDKTYRVIGAELSKCGKAYVFADGDIPLASGESTPIHANCMSAPDSCPGDVRIAVAVYDGDTLIEKKDVVLKNK